MENQEKFKEGIESYRRRIITELSYMNSSIDGFVDVRNMKFELRHLIQSYRRSLEKCNMYISGIEYLVEKKTEHEVMVRDIGDDTKNDTDAGKNALRTSVSGREDIT